MKFVSPAKICFMWKWPNVFMNIFSVCDILFKLVLLDSCRKG